MRKITVQPIFVKKIFHSNFESYDRGEDILPNTLLYSLLPQISVTVLWACRCYHRFPDQSIIDDLTQEIALSLLKNNSKSLLSFKHRSTEKTWLQRVVLYCVGHYFNSQKPTESLEDLPIDSLPIQPPSQEVEVFFKEREKLLDTARSRLTERERELWELLRSGLSDEEIARRMGIKVRSVQRERCAVLKKIRGVIEH